MRKVFLIAILAAFIVVILGKKTSPTKCPTRKNNGWPTKPPSKGPNKKRRRRRRRRRNDPTPIPTYGPTTFRDNNNTAMPSSPPTHAPSHAPTLDDAPSPAPTVEVSKQTVRPTVSGAGVERAVAIFSVLCLLLFQI